MTYAKYVSGMRETALASRLRLVVMRLNRQLRAQRTDQDVTLTLADGTTVLWGDAADSPRKASVLAALLGQVKSGALRPAKTIDVSAPRAVVLR